MYMQRYMYENIYNNNRNILMFIALYNVCVHCLAKIMNEREV